MTFTLGLPEISLGVLLVAAFQYLASLWISERLKTSLQWELKAREQAVRVAEYLALARNLNEESSETDYRKANQLSWELAMWLPANIYREMAKAITSPNENVNELSIVVSVRKLLLQKESGDLTTNDIAHHAPGIGKKPT